MLLSLTLVRDTSRSAAPLNNRQPRDRTAWREHEHPRILSPVVLASSRNVAARWCCNFASDIVRSLLARSGTHPQEAGEK